MAYATKSTSYSNYYFVVSSILDLCLIIKLLVEDTSFDYQFGKKTNKSKFTNLYFCRIKSIVVRDLLNLY